MREHWPRAGLAAAKWVGVDIVLKSNMSDIDKLKCAAGKWIPVRAEKFARICHRQEVGVPEWPEQTWVTAGSVRTTQRSQSANRETCACRGQRRTRFWRGSGRSASGVEDGAQSGRGPRRAERTERLSRGTFRARCEARRRGGHGRRQRLGSRTGWCARRDRCASRRIRPAPGLRDEERA
jgi:hypothetical protein